MKIVRRYGFAICQMLLMKIDTNRVLKFIQVYIMLFSVNSIVKRYKVDKQIIEISIGFFFNLRLDRILILVLSTR